MRRKIVCGLGAGATLVAGLFFGGAAAAQDPAQMGKEGSIRAQARIAEIRRQAVVLHQRARNSSPSELEELDRRAELLIEELRSLGYARAGRVDPAEAARRAPSLQPQQKKLQQAPSAPGSKVLQQQVPSPAGAKRTLQKDAIKKLP